MGRRRRKEEGEGDVETAATNSLLRKLVGIEGFDA